MTTAIIGTGGLGSVIARRLASGGETLRLSSADDESARTLAAEIGGAAVVAVDDRDVLQGADAVVLALRFTVLKGVIDEIADPLAGKLVVVPSNPLSIDAQGNVSRVLPEGRCSARWWPGGCRRRRAWPWRLEPCRPSSSSPLATGAEAGGALLRDGRRPCWRGSRAVDPNRRLRAGEGRRDRAVGSARGWRRPSRSRSRPRRGAVIDRWGLIAAAGQTSYSPSAGVVSQKAGPAPCRAGGACLPFAG